MHDHSPHARFVLILPILQEEFHRLLPQQATLQKMTSLDVQILIHQRSGHLFGEDIER